MDENQKHKRPHKRLASIDGIVSNGRQLGDIPRSNYKPTRGQPTPTLDNLIRRGDGFHPTGRAAQRPSMHSRSEIDEAEALLDKPIILDDIGNEKSRKRRHYFGHKHPRLHKNLKRASFALLALIIVGGAFFGYKLYNTKKHILTGGGQAPAVCDANVDPSKLKTEGDNRINVLLLGIGGEGHAAPDLTDTIMVASIDPVSHKVSLLSVPRDLWVQIPGNGAHKINQAYADAKQYSLSKSAGAKQKDGIKAIDATLESVLGIPIHYHMVVSFEAFKDVVDDLGGVDLKVSKEGSVYETLWIEGTSQHYTLNVQPGKQHFDGTRALFYARSRYTSPRGDFDRAERQRALMIAIKDKTLSAGTFADPLKVSRLLDSLGKNVYTDFDTGSLKCMYEHISKVPSANITSLDLVTPPNDLLTTGNLGGISIVQPKEGVFAYAAIQKYVRSSLRDGFISRENSKIVIYNATNIEGLATNTSETLKSYGYNIGAIDNTKPSTNPAQTKIIDLTKGLDKYTRHYLEKRFNVTASTSLPGGLGVTPPADADFVIILGKDVANTPQN